MTRRLFAFMLAALMLFSSMPAEALASTLPEETTSESLVVTTADGGTEEAVGETTAPAATEEKTAPAATEEKTAPAATEEKTAPAATEEKTAPAATEEKTAPAATEEKTAPAATEKKSASKTEKEDKTPEATEEENTKKDSAESKLQPLCGLEEHTHGESCNASTCEKKEHTHSAECYVAPVTKTETEPTEGETVPETTEEETVPETTEEETVPEATEEETVPATTEEETVPEATEEETVPETTEEETVPATTEEETVPETTEEETVPETTEGEPVLEGIKKEEFLVQGLADVPVVNAFDRETGYPTDLKNSVYLAVYQGTDFPGEPAWYSEAGYYFFNGNFNSNGVTTFASSAESVLKPEILDNLTQGPTTNGVKVWGHYSASGTKNYFVNGSSLLDRENEEKIIRRVKGNNVNVDDYEIIWYVIKFQTDSYWHIDGLVVEVNKYNVNYYGNGNTGGGAPNGATGLPEGYRYTVLDNIGNLVKVVNGESYTFTGWNTKADGTGTHYDPGDVIVITSDVSLYAQWEPPRITVQAQKVWADNDNRDGLRPESVTIRLLANGDVEDTAVLSNATSWTKQWHNLPRYANGIEINYEIVELNVPEGYTASYSEDETGRLYVTNTHVPATTSITATKVWNDGNDQDGIRPDSVTLTVYADGISTGRTVTVTGTGDTWTATVDGLTKYVNENGTVREIVYTLVEENANVPEGYTASSSGTTVTNTHTPEFTNIPFVKVWDDNDDQDGKRPDSITVNLLADGVKVDSKSVTAADNWKGVFENVVRYAGGEEIRYTVSEDAVEGYSTSVDGYTITNTYTPETAELTVVKQWRDFNDNDGKRPYGIVIELYENGTGTGKTVTLTEENGWTDSWTGMPLYKNGWRISYTTVEIGYYATEADYTANRMTRGVAAGYTVTHDNYDTVNHTSTVVNTYTPETTGLNIQKNWVDNDNQDGLQPASITFHLWMTTDASKVNTVPSEENGWTRVLDDNGSQMTAVFTRNADGTWTDVDFTNLPKYHNQTPIYYSVTETPVEGYTTGYSLDLSTGVVTVTNTHEAEKTSVTVTKKWNDNNDQDGIRPASVTVSLYGPDKVNPLDTVTLTEANGWEYTWTDLEKNYKGTEIIYTVTEAVVEGYETTINGHEITNTHIPETTDISFNKVWDDEMNQDGIRPASVTVTLYADGEAVKTMGVSAFTNWSGMFEDLPVYRDGGEKIRYTVGEAETDIPDGYVSTVEGTTITNTHEVEKTAFTVTKVWNDNDNQDGKRPASVEVTLYANDVEYDKQTLSEANGWTYTWTELDKKAGGRDILYTVDELTVPDGYSRTVSGGTITNTHVPETTSVTVVKNWEDANNQDGMRPRLITIRLLADGTEVDSAEVYATTNWTYTFNNLPKYADGSEIVYTVSEDKVEGYEIVIDGTTITNKHVPETTDIEVTKTWDDAGNQDGIRPGTVRVELYADGTKVDEIVITAEDEWVAVFSDKPVYANGKKIHYTIREVNVPDGYTASVNGTTVTNSHTPETVDIPVSKVWNDGNNQDGIRPDSVIVNLLANGTEIGEIRLDSTNTWKHIFRDLPKYADGAEILYTLTEDAVPGYTSAFENGVFTNTHIPEETSLKVVKLWEDSDDNDNVRPNAITVYLYADGEPYAGSPNSMTITAEGNWTGTFEHLPKYDSGEAIRYIVYEETIGEGYSPSYVRAEDGSLITITNKRDIETTSITAQKVWNDADNRDGIRPGSVRIQLYKTVNGVKTAVGEPVTVDSTTTWTKQWSELPVLEDGEEITYTVEELNVPAGYTVSYTTDSFGRLVITNTHEPEKTEVTFKKIWVDGDNQDGKRPETITVNLLANGSKIRSVTVDVTAENSQSGTFADLDKYANGKEIVYTVTEEAVEGYTTTIDGTTITNTHTPEKTEVTFNKIWDDADNQDGVRPDSITVQLLADGETVDSMTVKAADNWSGTFADLDKYADGNEIVYTITEDEVDGYDTAIDGYTITNSHKPAETEITAVKVWNDANNQDGKRPASVTLHLLANGEHTGMTAVLSEETGWTYQWTGLDKYEAGVEITYQVKEETIGNGYSTSIDGFTVTNTYNPEKTSVNVWKKWNDANDQDGLRPTSITVRLYADGVYKAAQTLTADNNWQYSFTDLDKYANGKEIVYTVEELQINGYSTIITGNTADGYTITNSHEVYLTDVTVTKNWVDADNQDGIRPEEITLYLYGRDKTNALDAVTVQPDENGSWTYTWKDLPKNYNGHEISYTVREEAVEGYTPGYAETPTTTVITNTHKIEKTEVSFHKLWDDAMNQDGIRPASITVNLLADGEEVDSMTVTAADNWAGTFRNLDKYSEGVEIEYTVTEEPVEDYTTEIEGTTITNTHIPENRDLNMVKAWDDFNDNDGKRPYAVLVTLLDNGVPAENVAAHNAGNTNPIVITAQDDWKGAWLDMPTFRGGQRISYTIIESGVYMTEEDRNSDTVTAITSTGYTVTHSYDTTDPENPVATVTNKYTPETTGLNVQKVWNDDYNREGIRPAEITVTLYRKIGENGTWEVMKNSEGTDITAVLNPENEWDADFTGLPAYSGGKKIIYNVVETPVEGYEEPEYVLDNETNVVTITNTREINKNVSVEVTKAWYDRDDQDGIRPDEITVRLYANGIATSETKVLNEDNKWTAKWEGLYDYYKGNQIVYTVEEESVPGGYTGSVAVSRDGDKVTAVITNTHEPAKISIPVEKNWDDNGNQDGMRPHSLTVALWANGERTDKVLTLNAGNNWQSSFEDLDKFANGEEIRYSIEEAAIEGYNVDENGQAQPLTVSVVDGKISITNVHEIKKTTLTAKKVWEDDEDRDGKRPASITVHLLANGVHLGEAYKRVLTAEEDWTYTWTDLDMYSAGQPIRYTVYEEPITFPAAEDSAAAQAVSIYDASYVRDSETQITITNTYIPETTVISVKKLWQDGDNRDGIRPGTLTVKLLANGKETGRTLVLSEENSWSGGWTDLYKYENHGTEIIYTVAEEEIPNGYTCETVNDDTTFILANTHSPETTSVKVRKIWADENNNDGKRPEGIIVQLYANGSAVEGERVVLSEDNEWCHIFRGTASAPLYVYEQGELISYSVREVGYVDDGVEKEGLPEGYEGNTDVTGDGYEISITNTRASEKLDLAVKKVWDDGDDNDRVRPKSVRVTLVKNGRDVETVTLNKSNEWKHIWTDLYKYAGGVEVKYTVREKEVEGYTDSYAYSTSTDGKVINATVTNTHIPETEEFAVKKVWKDDNDAEDLRPDSVTVQIYKNGKAYGEKIVLSAKNKWQSPMELPVYEDGEEIEWTIKELKIPRYYTASYNQRTLTVTNTIQSKKVPKTGDYNNLGMWFGLLGICGAGAAGVLFYDKKKKYSK